MADSETEFSPDEKLTLQHLVVKINIILAESPEDKRLPGTDQAQFLIKEHPEFVSRFREIGREISNMKITDEEGPTLAEVEEDLAKLREERVALLERLIIDNFDGSLSDFKDWLHTSPPVEINHVAEQPRDHRI